MDAPTNAPFRSWCERTLALAFVLFCALPGALTWLQPPPSGSIEREFRRPAPEPKAPQSLAEIELWPAAFDAWFRDHYGLRADWIRLNNRLSIEIFGVSPTTEIVLGPDAWMFTTRDRAVDVWRGADPFSAEELELWGKVLADRREWCAQRGVKYLFAIAPNKESIYPEFFPARFDKAGPSRREQLVQHVAARSDFPLLDLTVPILTEKALAQPKEQLYYRLGTHWNDRGAVPAARALLERLHSELPQVSAPAREAFTFVPTEFQDDSWAGRLYMEDVLRQPNADAAYSRAIPAAAWERLRKFLERRDKTPEERVRFAIRPEADESVGWAIDVLDSMNVDVVREGVELPRAVVFHDSMGEKLRPLLAESFSRVAFRWVPDFDTNVIEREQPDVVLQVFVERALAATSLSTSPLDSQEVLEREFRASTTTLLAGLNELTLPAGTKSRISQQGDDGLTLEYGGTALELPPLVVPPGTWPVLRIELSSPVDTALCLEFLTGRFATYSRLARGVQRPISASGTQVVHVKLRVPGLAGRIRLHPGLAAGVYALRSLEVRAVPQ